MANTTKHVSLYSSHYERMSGNCTRILASQMISSLSPSIDESSYILDNACGPGIVTEQIKLHFPNAKILATDLAPSMISEVQDLVKSNDWKNVKTDTLDVRDLANIKTETFTHVITNLGMPVPGDNEFGAKSTKEMYRVLRIGGVAVMSTWADRVWVNAFYNAARTIRPNENPPSLMTLEPEILRASWLATQLELGGFGNNFEVRPCTTYTMAPTLDELVDNMMLAKTMFFGSFSDEELRGARSALSHELQKLRTFEKTENGVRIGMKAWIGVGWKNGDEHEVAV